MRNPASWLISHHKKQPKNDKLEAHWGDLCGEPLPAPRLAYVPSARGERFHSCVKAAIVLIGITVYTTIIVSWVFALFHFASIR